MKKTKGKPCPSCGKPAAWDDNPFRPFCSERCKLIDLGNWASEKYSIPDRLAGADEVEDARALDEERDEDRKALH